VLATRRSTGDPVVDAVARWGTWLVVGGASVGLALVAADAHTIGAPRGAPPGAAERRNRARARCAPTWRGRHDAPFGRPGRSRPGPQLA
jgi:hypothetical protein